MSIIKPISEAFEFIRNGISVKQNSETSGVAITRIETIADRSINPNKVGYADIDINDLGKFKNYLLKNGDILMSHINSPKHLGKTAIYQQNPDKLIHGMNLLCLRIDSINCNSTYANYYFQSPFFLQDLAKISNKSVNQASFSVGRLKDLKIPLPPLKTQQRIAAILDDAAALRDKTAQLLKEYDLLAQSIFLEMFGDFKSSKRFDKVKLKTYCKNISKINKEYSENEIKYVDISSINNLQNTIINTTNYTLNDRPSRAQQILNIGDILYSTVRPNLKNVAVVLENGLIGSTGFTVLRVKEELNRYYLFSLLKSDNFTNYVMSLVSGANYPAIRQSVLMDIEIPFPPIHLQTQFAEKIALIEQQKELAKQELQESEDLFNCLLQQSFKGELV